MSIALRKRPAEGVPTPSPMHITFFADQNGNPSLKDEHDVVTPATNAGNPVRLNEQGSAPTPVADAVKIFAQDVGGKSELHSLDDGGDVTQITSNGRVKGADLADATDNQTLQTLNGSATTIATYSTLADERAISMRCRVIAREPATQDSARYLIEAFFNRDGSSVVTSLDETIVTSYEDQAAWDVTFNIVGPDIEVQVTGEIGKTIEWRVQLEMIEHGA